MKLKYISVTFLLLSFFSMQSFSQTYTVVNSLQVLKGSGTPPAYNFMAGDVLVQRNAITVNGVNYDAVFRILSKNMGGTGTFTLYNNSTIRFTNINARLDPTVQYNVTMTEAGSATATHLTGTPVSIENLTLYLPDLDGDGGGNPARMYVDAGGYRLPTGYAAPQPTVTAASALAMRTPKLFNSSKASDYNIYRAEVPSQDETDNILYSGSFLNTSPFVLKLQFSTFPVQGIDLMFATTADPSQYVGNPETGSRQIFHVFSTDDQTVVLPVSFGAVNATIKNNQLFVNWASNSENNNDHFVIEVSKDGKTWNELTSVKSKAVDGNSSAKIDYSYNAALGTIAGLFAIPALLAIGLAGFSRRQNIIISLAVIAIALFGYSCTKQDNASTDHVSQKIWVRIAQVDKDGTKKYSEIVKAVAE